VVDRRIIGYVAIILVITTLIALFVFQVGEDELIRILASRTPDNIPGRRPGSPSYSIDLIAVQDLPDLFIQLNFLQNLTKIPLLKLWNETTSREYNDMVANVPRLANLKTHLDMVAGTIGVESLYDEYEIEKTDRKIYVLDITDAIIAFAGAETQRTVYTVYAFNVGPGGKVSVFGGYRDFFLYARSFYLDRKPIVGEIQLTTPTETKCFRSEEIPGEMGSCQRIFEAPIGKLKIRNLSTDDRINIKVTLNTINMFGHSGILEVVTTETGHGSGPSIVEWIGASGN
jgi:hypothetical protein